MALSFHKEKEEADWSENYQQKILFYSTPDKISFDVVPLYHPISTCDPFFSKAEKNIWDPHFATCYKENQIVKNVDLIDFLQVEKKM